MSRTPIHISDEEAHALQVILSELQNSNIHRFVVGDMLDRGVDVVEKLNKILGPLPTRTKVRIVNPTPTHPLDLDNEDIPLILEMARVARPATRDADLAEAIEALSRRLRHFANLMNLRTEWRSPRSTGTPRTALRRRPK